jgi:hypothetical protein
MDTNQVSGLDPVIKTGDKFPLILLRDLPEKERAIFLDCYSSVSKEHFVLHTVFSAVTVQWMCEELDKFLCERLDLKPQESCFIEHDW